MDAHIPQQIDHRTRMPLEEPLGTQHKLALVASKGSLDWAYPPLMMANNAATKRWEVGIFFTFYGLNIIHRRKSRVLRFRSWATRRCRCPFPRSSAPYPA